MNWNTPVRPFFRVLGAVIGTALVAYAFLAFTTDLKYTYHPKPEWIPDGIFGGLPPLILGIIFVIVAIRGRLYGK
ncbi:MAG: hypothetical protein A2X59_03095 [Nitrospirae bacterium GWC2_42_7]|nr:MAG: hypothetical protein A2X59_03095 [Nitrospirae bacterium GWC2_42_7]